MSSTNNIPHNLILENTLKTWLKEKDNNFENTTQEIIRTTFQIIMEAERDVFLGYKYGNETRKENKRNGYYSRLAKMLNGVIELKIPRDRMGRFKPLILEIIKKEQSNLNQLMLGLYGKGMSTRDINDIVEETYGMKTSPQYISNLTDQLLEIRGQWQQRKLSKEYYFIYIDAIHLNIRRDTVDNEAVYVVLGLNKDFKREILGLYSIPEESASGWKDCLKDLKRRGLEECLLFIADGLTGLENVIHQVYPKSDFQKCIVHLKRNVLKKIRAKDKPEVSDDLKKLFQIDTINDTKEQGLQRLDWFLSKWAKQDPSLKNKFSEGLKDYYFTYLKFPYQIRRMIYTTNWIERLNKEIRKVCKNKNSFPNENSALNLIWMKLMDFEEKRYVFPVTAFYPVEEGLQDMF